MHIKPKYKILILIVIIASLLFCLSGAVFGDVGNHTDYSTGFDPDDWGDDDFSNLWLFELFLRIIMSSALPWPIKIVVFIGVIVFIQVMAKNRKTKHKTRISPPSLEPARDEIKPFNYSELVENEIKKYDVNFDTLNFLGWAEEVFITIQQAWTERSWGKIRPFEKEELYRKHQLQLQEYITNKTINVVERVNVNETYLYKYKREAEYEHLSVYLQARMNDYVIDENTREVVKGDKNREYHIKYYLTFTRKIGVLTNASTNTLNTHQCPNCGAPLKMTSSGMCEYCSNIVTTGEYNWVLSDLDSIRDSAY